ncbi:outer membrane protein assembly factor BamE [Halomonas piscis]|nr:outer membrane protein assembly factor BamE [Halomonas piscis]
MIDQNHDSEEQAQMQKLTRIIALSVTLATVSGCSTFGVYKRDIPQGNLITQEMVQQLRPGMSQRQVTQVMGRPLLEAPFDAREWDYVFQLDKAYSGVETRRLTLTFDDTGQLVNIEKDGNIAKDLPLDINTAPGASEGADPLKAMPEESTGVSAPEAGPASTPRR